MRANATGHSGGDALKESLRENPVCLILALFSAFAAFMIGGLTGFHAFLLSQNATTNEQVKIEEEEDREREKKRERYVDEFCLMLFFFSFVSS